MFGIESGLFSQMIYSLIIILASLIVSKLLGYFMVKFAERSDIDAHSSKPVIRFISILVYIIAAVLLLGVWGLRAELTSLLAGAGFAGIVIGFAVKDMLADILAGIMLFFDRPFKIGHTINMDDLWGKVLDIGIRSTKIRTLDGKFVTIPNSKVAESVITDVSVYEGRRLELIVGVDYDADLKKAKKSIENAVKRMEKKGMIKPEPKTKILIDEFAGSSINFKILFWYDPEYTKEHGMWFGEIKGELIDAIKREFEKAGITIPFPQVTVSQRNNG